MVSDSAAAGRYDCAQVELHRTIAEEDLDGGERAASKPELPALGADDELEPDAADQDQPSMLP